MLRGTGAVSEAMQSFAAMKPVIAYDGDPDIVVIDAIALVSNAWTMSALLPDCTMHRAGGVSGDAAALEQLVVGVRNRDFHPG